ncbi:DEAD/DEAH box helicase [Bacillus sp. DJP31]|uniref:DEAD/DEAH box helicase n=1 Tax=Bacillus sp. DJP31 TaxID=3409789 RepID=UPI003BB79B60
MRKIRQPSNGIRLDSWIKENEVQLVDGVYCQECSSHINEEFLSTEERILFKDNRMETWSFQDYSIKEVVNKIKNVGEKLGSNVEQYSISNSEPVFGELDRPLPEALSNKLKDRGIERLYSHQAEAINRVRNGENVIISTGTASGKSMIYTIPSLELFLNDEDSTVLYLSPLKALTRDQLQSLDFYNDEINGENTSFAYKTINLGNKIIKAGVLEGGKSDLTKELTYQNARYWLTNVHYLHFILQGAVHFKSKNHFIRFFKNLKLVVLDELHAYNGVLGSKVAMLLRRLRILCKALGNTDLQFIACSASIGNPKELAEEITGLKGRNEFSLIDKDGSPLYEREILLWNPGMLEQKSEHRTRRAPISEAIEILGLLTESYRMLPKTIMFYGNRRATTNASFELNNAIRSKLGEISQGQGVDIPFELFSPFHAQLNSHKKQEVMDRLKKGELLGLVSTSALEMGIDIGDLNLCIMIGYAGNKASFLQQAGRVGRKGPGLVIQIFNEYPLEQYYASNPVEFMERAPEQVTIDVANSNIVSEHMQYAAHEVNGKITSAHNYFKVSAARKAEGFSDSMEEIGRGTWSLKIPDLKYNNLLSTSKLYSVVCTSTSEHLYEGVDERSLLRDYHYGAVFLYNQRTYKVTRISQRNNEILTAPFKADYTTRSQINDSIYVVEEVTRSNLNHLVELGRGRLEITRRLWGYKKVNLFGGSSTDLIEDGNMYPVKYSTEGLWIQLKRDNTNEINEGTLHVIEHAIASAIPTIVKCSHSDFSLLSSFNLKEFNFIPTIVCYETSGGGAGIMEVVEQRLLHILKKGLEILKSCPCSNGCPNCTHLSFCERNNDSLDKSGGILLMESIVADEVLVLGT